jgi:hypothetical protein
MKRLALCLCLLFLMFCFGCETGDEADDEPPTPNTSTRAWNWVRNNPMFISALTVSMGPPPKDYVDNYFNNFHANAAHLWMDGLPTEVDGWKAAGNPSFRYVTWLQNDGTSASKIIGGYAPDAPGRIGFQIGDEPSRGCATLECTMNALNTMAGGINAVRAYDRNALLFVDFKKSDFLDSEIAHYGQNIDGDIFCYNNYNRGRNAYVLLEKFRTAGLQYNKPYWRYMRSYYDPADYESISESDMRWDAFVGLVYGYTGHTWFLYNIRNNGSHDPDVPALFNAQGDFNAGQTALWGIAAQINLEMQNLGRAITQLTSKEVCYIPIQAMAQPDKTQNWKRGTGGDEYITDIEPDDKTSGMELLVGFFVDGAGEIYFMVQNLAHTHGDFPLDKAGRETAKISFNFKGASGDYSRSSLLMLNKLTGGVEILPLDHSDGDEGYLKIKLSAGDPVLLKYDNGKAFAIR